MRILVCGGRVRTEQRFVYAVLDRLAKSLPKPLTIIHGGARQTDTFAGAWARDRGHIEDAYPIDAALDGYTEEAPKMRNWRMAEAKPDVVLAFPGGPGTRNMIEIARIKGFPIWDVELEDRQFQVFQWGKSPKEKARVIALGTF